MKFIYRNIKSFSLDAFEEIKNVESKVSRIIDYIAFLSIVIITSFAGLTADENFKVLQNNCYLLIELVMFIGFTIYTLIKNIQCKFLLNGLDKNIERLTVLLSVPLIFYFG